MNHEPDTQKINSYLLGSLPPAETEIFDELSFTDERFAEALTAAENELIDEYLNGELTGETLHRFETFYLASPVRREKVEFARALQTIAGRQLIEKEPARESAGSFARLKRYRLQLAFAMGALLIVVLGAYFFIARRDSPDIVTQNSPAASDQSNNQPEIPAANPTANPPQSSEPANTAKPPPNKNTNNGNSPKPSEKPTAAPSPPPKPVLASFVLTPPLRNTQIASFPISRETTDIAVRLELESSDFPAYRVTLTDAAGRRLRQFADLRARGNSLEIRFPAKTLKSGVYTFEVAGVKDGAAEIISNYAFRVVLR